MNVVARLRRLAKAAVLAVAIGLFRPIRDRWRTLRRRHPVRVFTFQRVTAICRDKVTVTPDGFRERIEYIARHHDVVDLDTALRAIEENRPLRRPLAVITFDDGYQSVFEHARPTLAERGLPASCFVATGYVGTDKRFAHDAASPVRQSLSVMGWTDLGALHASGWTIGAHTATHQRLSACSAEAYATEIDAPLATLRDRLGLEEVAIAYPFGGRADINARARSAVHDAGYRACFSNYGGENFPGDPLLELKRFNIGGDMDSLAWRARVHGIDLRLALATWGAEETS